MVFQLHHLLPHLTARENVEAAMFGTHRRASERARRATELLEHVGLDAVAESRPPELSGGERQRVAVARAIANEPAVVLADEPTGSLDDASTALVLDVLTSERARGATILLVTHDERAAGVADRRLWLDHGVVGPVGA